jgi:hypothetical protein
MVSATVFSQPVNDTLLHEGRCTTDRRTCADGARLTKASKRSAGRRSTQYQGIHWDNIAHASTEWTGRTSNAHTEKLDCSWEPKGGWYGYGTQPPISQEIAG